VRRGLAPEGRTGAGVPEPRGVREEAADILIYLVRLPDTLGIDLLAAAQDKIKKNGR